MELPVLVQPMNGKGFVASVGSPLNLSVQGSTVEEAMANLRTEALRQTSNGNRLMTLEMPDANRANQDEDSSVDPWAIARAKGMILDPVEKDAWLSIAGTWDDETYEMFQQGLEEYRRQVEADPDIL